MRMPWSQPKAKQLELLDAEPDAPHDDGWRPGQHDELFGKRRQMMDDWARFLAGRGK